MNKLRGVFIDTSAWIMLLNADEGRHKEAVSTYAELHGAGKFTSNMVVGETYTWMRMRAGYERAIEYLQTINKMVDEKFLTVIWSDAEMENKASDYLRKYHDHNISYADAVSFSIMDKLNIQHAFAYDKHFLIAGFYQVND